MTVVKDAGQFGWGILHDTNALFLPRGSSLNTRRTSGHWHSKTNLTTLLELSVIDLSHSYVKRRKPDVTKSFICLLVLCSQSNFA